MKKIKYIKNISLDTVNINSIEILPGQKVDLTTYDTLFKCINGYNDIIRLYNQNYLEVYDITNEVMSNEEFIEYFNYFSNRFLSLNSYYKLYEFLTDDAISRYNNFSLTPKSVDYIKDVDTRFVRKETFTYGFLTNVQYFESSENINGVDVYTNPILNVNIIYHINQIGDISYRETVRKWYKNDGTLSSDSKITYKKYSGISSRDEAIRRRSNIINQLVIDTIGLTYNYYKLTNTFDEVAAMIVPLLDDLDSEVNKYIKGNLQPLIEKFAIVDTNTYPWLNIIFNSITLKDYITTKLLEAIIVEGSYSSTSPI